jgi:large subunit ribosomal protein L31
LQSVTADLAHCRVESGSGSPRTIPNEDPAATEERDKTLKTGIHPEYVTTEVTCGCGNTFSTRSTKTSGAIHVEICANCHPFYTGKQKIMDTGGRVARFEARYGKRAK